MKVEMQGGPHDGEIYPHVKSGADDLHVDGKDVPIYWDASKDKQVAKWDEAKDS